LQLAQSRLEAAGVTEVLAPGQREGRASDNCRWLETVTAVRTGAETLAQPLPAAPGHSGPPPAAPPIVPAAFWVEVMVQAADGTVVKLGALKLGSRRSGAGS
jgi:hypothetical protein